MPNNRTSRTSSINSSIPVSASISPRIANPFLKVINSHSCPSSNKNLSKINKNDWKVIDEHIMLTKGEPQREISLPKTLREVIISHAPTLLGLSPNIFMSLAHHIPSINSPGNAHSNITPSLFSLENLCATVSSAWQIIPALPQWPSGASANPLTLQNPNMHKPSDSINVLKTQLQAFQLTSDTFQNTVLINYLVNKYVLFFREDDVQPPLERIRRELDDGRSRDGFNRLPTRGFKTLSVINPAVNGNSSAAEVIRWADRQMQASRILFTLAWDEGVGGIAAYLGAGLASTLGAFAQTLGAIMDGTLLDREPGETHAEWLLRLSSNIIIPPEAAAARAFKVNPTIINRVTPSSPSGLRVSHKASGLMRTLSPVAGESRLYLNVQDKSYALTPHTTEGVYRLNNGREIYLNPLVGEWRRFCSGNSHLNAKSLSAIPDELLRLSPGDHSVLAFRGEISPESKVWTQPDTGKYYLEVLKLDPENQNSVVSHYIEGHLEGRFFSIKNPSQQAHKHPLLEWKSGIGKWEVVANANSVVTNSVTSPIFRGLPSSVQVVPLVTLDPALSLPGFTHTYRLDNTGEIFIRTGTTRRGVAQYIKVEQSKSQPKIFRLNVFDRAEDLREIRYYRYQENGEFTLDNVVSCHRVKRAEDNLCQPGTSGQASQNNPSLLYKKTAEQNSKIIADKIHEMRLNTLEMVPIQRPNLPTVRTAVSIEDIQNGYRSMIIAEIPITRVLKLFESQKVMAEAITTRYNKITHGKAPATSAEYSYILFDKLIKGGISNDNLLVVNFSLQGEVKHTALFFSSHGGIERILGPTTSVFEPQAVSIEQLYKASQSLVNGFEILNPWSDKNKHVVYKAGASRDSIKRDIVKILKESGIEINDDYIPGQGGVPKYRGTLRLEDVKLVAQDPVRDSYCLLNPGEAKFRESIRENYGILARGEAVLNEPMGTMKGRSSSLGARFDSINQIFSQLAVLDDNQLRAFIKEKFGEERLDKKTDLFRRSIVQTLNNLNSYRPGGGRVNRLVLLKSRLPTSSSEVLGFVTNDKNDPDPFFSIIHKEQWGYMNLFTYASQMHLICHEMSHVPEPGFLTDNTRLKTYDFFYNNLAGHETFFQPYPNRISSYSLEHNDVVFSKDTESHLVLKSYDEYLTSEHEESVDFKSVDDRVVFKVNIDAGFNKKIAELNKLIGTYNAGEGLYSDVQLEERYLLEFTEHFNEAMKKSGLSEIKLGLKTLTRRRNDGSQKLEIDPNAYEAMRRFFQRIANDKEARIAIVMNNADSITYYQFLLAAEKELISPHLPNGGRLPKPDERLPWADSDESEDSEMSDKR